MKTIKELERLKLREDRSFFNKGYYEALKDVLELIDEMAFLTKPSKLINADELKQKIKGE